MTILSQSVQPHCPQLTSSIVGSVIFMIEANWRALSTYWSAVLAPICQAPYISLPSPQYRTLYGSRCPLARRRLAHDVSPVPLQYSTQAWASSIVPEPMLTQMYGSAPSARQYWMNSSVPKWFDS